MPMDDMSTALIAGLVVVVGGLAWLVHEAIGRKRSKRMETYLRLERETGADRGQRSTNQIMAALGMTSGQVLDGARRSQTIKRLAIIAHKSSVEPAIFEYGR